MLIASLQIIVGFILLVWSADRFVSGASSLALNLGVSSMLIGLTVVALGSSAPEMMVSAAAALNGSGAIAVGNAIGSNITNIGLVLATCICIRPISVLSATLFREYPFFLLLSFASLGIVMDLHLGLVDGLILVGLLIAAMGVFIRAGMARDSSDPMVTEANDETLAAPHMSTKNAVLWLLLGMILLPLSAQILVSGASDIARGYGVSELVIGLTIIAIGTSLPELAASVAGLLKGEDDLAVGNVVGSNIFNLGAVLALPAFIEPLNIESEALYRDLPVMIGLSVALVLVSLFKHNGEHRIPRWVGPIMLAVYCSYIGYVILSI